MDNYRRPFLKPGEDRRPTLSWPRQIPIHGEPAHMVQLVQDTSRDSALAMMKLNNYLDILIPRGGAGLIRAVVRNPGAMAVWAAAIVALTAIGIATAFVGLALIFPVLGYATWHSYRSLIGQAGADVGIETLRVRTIRRPEVDHHDPSAVIAQHMDASLHIRQGELGR